MQERILGMSKNKINYRKEFFAVSISEVKDKIESLGYNVHWTMKAEAQEYRETQGLNKKRPAQEDVECADAG